jgi:transcriptional regulator with XRE-family HTH domain
MVSGDDEIGPPLGCGHGAIKPGEDGTMDADVNEGPGWYDPEATTFGDRMTGAREASGFSQAELARRLGVKVKTIRAWENDQSEPRANKLQMLAGMLGVSIMWLLSGAGDGLDGPEERSELSEDLAELLKELRRIKVDQARMSERMGRLEKRLRLALSQGV